MKLGYKQISLIAIAVVAGLVVLAGYSIQLDELLLIRATIVNWVVILAGVALMMGVLNLAKVHWARIKKRNPGWQNSWVLLVSLLVTVGIAVFFGPTAAPSMWLYNHIQVPLETSMFALLAIILVAAIARLSMRRMSSTMMLFVSTVLVVLLGTVSFPGMELTVLQEIRLWLAQTWAAAGARGILLGVALGTIATGVRVLMGVDRPYSG